MRTDQMVWALRVVEEHLAEMMARQQTIDEEIAEADQRTYNTERIQELYREKDVLLEELQRIQADMGCSVVELKCSVGYLRWSFEDALERAKRPASDPMHSVGFTVSFQHPVETRAADFQPHDKYAGQAPHEAAGWTPDDD